MAVLPFLLPHEWVAEIPEWELQAKSQEDCSVGEWAIRPSVTQHENNFGGIEMLETYKLQSFKVDFSGGRKQ